MKFTKSIKWRLTTSLLLMFLFMLCVVIGFSYYTLAKAVYSNEGCPSSVYTTEIDITDSTNNTAVSFDYIFLSSYTITENRVSEIKNGDSGIFNLATPLGILEIDQSRFISDDMQGGQKVWIYYRLSPVDATKYELMMFARPVDETRQLMGQFTNVIILILPVVIVLAFLVCLVLIKRLFRPIDRIKNAALQISTGNYVNKIEVDDKGEFGELAKTVNHAFNRLQEAVEHEQQLIAEASHELRAPLTVMQGEATLALRQKRTTEEYEDCLKTITQETSYLSSLINKLLILTRLDRENNNVNLSEVDLSQWLDDLSSDFKLLCEENGLPFSLDIEKYVRIIGDEYRLKELVLNLVENAVKYNRPKGRVFLSLSKEKKQAIIRVRDTGIGIESKHLSRIFDMYYRVGKSSSRSQEGTGLGLYICRRIAELHNGNIEVESEPGKGSTFTVYLPLP